MKQIFKPLKDKIEKHGGKFIDTPQGIPGWQFMDIGKEEGKNDWDLDPNGNQWTARSAVWCAGNCGKFIGRWPVPMRYRAWCKECVIKLE